jgi:hypothetical protein
VPVVGLGRAVQAHSHPDAELLEESQVGMAKTDGLASTVTVSAVAWRVGVTSREINSRPREERLAAVQYQRDLV